MSVLPAGVLRFWYLYRIDWVFHVVFSLQWSTKNVSTCIINMQSYCSVQHFCSCCCHSLHKVPNVFSIWLTHKAAGEKNFEARFVIPEVMLWPYLNWCSFLRRHSTWMDATKVGNLKLEFREQSVRVKTIGLLYA